MTSQHQHEQKTVQLPLNRSQVRDAHAVARQPIIRYDKLVDYSLTETVYNIWDEASGQGHPIVKDMEQTDFLYSATCILASIPNVLLSTLVAGNLEQAIMDNKEVTDLFKPDSTWLGPSAEDDTPMIYARVLVDKHSRIPTPTQYRNMIARLREYISGDKLFFRRAAALEIDSHHSATAEDIRQGKHRWLNGNENRAQAVETFCKPLEDRLEQDTIRTPHMYIGYTKDPERRRNQHSKGESSSWLQQLVLAAFQAEYPEDDIHFTSRAICYMAYESEVGLAEAVLTIITDSAYQTGGGFNMVPGGIQVGSAKFRHLSTEGKNARWEERQLWRKLETPWFLDNMKVEYHRLLERRGFGHIPGLQQFRKDAKDTRDKVERKKANIKSQRDWLSSKKAECAHQLQLAERLFAKAKDIEGNKFIQERMPEWKRDHEDLKAKEHAFNKHGQRLDAEEQKMQEIDQSLTAWEERNKDLLVEQAEQGHSDMVHQPLS
jgi:hypothetical protein